MKNSKNPYYVGQETDLDGRWGIVVAVEDLYVYVADEDGEEYECVCKEGELYPE